jgi:hypothetical protein
VSRWGAIQRLELTINCSACGKAVVLTGRARSNALLRGRGYCPPPSGCGAIGASALLSAAARARMADPTRCERQSAVLAAWRATTVGALLSVTMKDQWADPVYRARQVALRSVAATIQWADPEVRANFTGEKNHGWLGSYVGYGGRHMRLKMACGPASAHQCADCPRQAQDWSLNAGVPLERLRADSTGRYQGSHFSVGQTPTTRPAARSAAPNLTVASSGSPSRRSTTTAIS